MRSGILDARFCSFYFWRDIGLDRRIPSELDVCDIRRHRRVVWTHLCDPFLSTFRAWALAAPTEKERAPSQNQQSCRDSYIG